MSEHRLFIEGAIGEAPVKLQGVYATGGSVWDFSTYASAVPGVLVALLGLWISHALTRRRERRKEILDLCKSIHEKVDALVTASHEAWLAAAGDDRRKKVKDVKARLQSLGIVATTLKRRTRAGPVTHLLHTFNGCPLSIDIVERVSELRSAITQDPFEEPDRVSPDAPSEDIGLAAKRVSEAIDEGINSVLS